MNELKRHLRKQHRMKVFTKTFINKEYKLYHLYYVRGDLFMSAPGP